MSLPFLFFSPLEGVFLDRDSHWADAAPAVGEVIDVGARVVFVSRDGAEEMVRFLNQIGLRGPAIIEAGAAVLLPPWLDDPPHPRTWSVEPVRGDGRAYSAAVARVRDWYHAQLGAAPPAAAIGSIAADASLLAAVDRPFVAPGPDGAYDPALAALPGVVRVGPAPAGWAEAVFQLLTEFA